MSPVTKVPGKKRPRVKASQPHSLNKIERFEVQIALFPYFLFCFASARRDSFKCPEGVRVLSELQPLPSFTGTGVDSSGLPGLKLIESKVSQLPTFLKSPNKTLKSLQGSEPKMCCVKDTYYFSLPSEASPSSLVTDLWSCDPANPKNFTGIVLTGAGR